jgi:hypothetical protein
MHASCMMLMQVAVGITFHSRSTARIQSAFSSISANVCYQRPGTTEEAFGSWMRAVSHRDDVAHCRTLICLFLHARQSVAMYEGRATTHNSSQGGAGCGPHRGDVCCACSSLRCDAGESFHLARCVSKRVRSVVCDPVCPKMRLCDPNPFDEGLVTSRQTNKHLIPVHKNRGGDSLHWRRGGAPLRTACDCLAVATCLLGVLPLDASS